MTGDGDTTEKCGWTARVAGWQVTVTTEGWHQRARRTAAALGISGIFSVPAGDGDGDDGRLTGDGDNRRMTDDDDEGRMAGDGDDSDDSEWRHGRRQPSSPTVLVVVREF